MGKPEGALWSLHLRYNQSGTEDAKAVLGATETSARRLECLVQASGRRVRRRGWQD